MTVTLRTVERTELIQQEKAHPSLFQKQSKPLECTGQRAADLASVRWACGGTAARLRFAPVLRTWLAVRGGQGERVAPYASYRAATRARQL